MILKGLKEKSNKNYIDKCVKNRVMVSNSNIIKTVGFIVDDSEFLDLDWINKLSEVLKVKKENFEILALTNPKSKTESIYPNTFSRKDLGWKGNVKTETLKSFLNKKNDLLISYYTSDKLPLIFATATSEAKFKVGLVEETNVNDLVIKTDIKDTSTFENELVKYLRILNKL